MKRAIVSMLCCVLFCTAHAQHITKQFDDVPLCDALRQIDELSDEYTISFMYNELEDFRVTTYVHRKTVPETVRQLIGFYPVQVSILGKEITVECMQQIETRYKGTVIDELGKPVAYANIALLASQDSTLIAGGVSNERGHFVIPCSQCPVIARISFMGYKTVYMHCSSRNIGCVNMQPEPVMLNGVQIKGERIIMNTGNGHLTYNMETLLELFPADDAYEALTRIPGVVENDGTLTFGGRKATLIINGKVSSLSQEQIVERLRNIPASMIAKAEVMPSAPAKYHVHGMAINVIMKDFDGTNQFSGQLTGLYRQSKYGYGAIRSTVLYQHGKLGIDASFALGYGDAYGKVEHMAHHPLGCQRMDYSDRTDRKSRTDAQNLRIGLDYAFADKNRLNIAYTGNWQSSDANNISKGLETSLQHSDVNTYIHNVDANYTSPFGLNLSVSYTNYRNPRTQHLDGKLYENTRNLSVSSQQRINKWLLTADQTHSFKNGWELNYGIEAQMTGNVSYQTTLDAEGRPVVEANSSVDYNERIVDIYAGFNKQITPAVSLEASVGAQQYHAQKWDEWRLYPTVNALWNIDKKNNLNFSFNSQAVYPSYWSTMSSIFYSSAYSEIWGNPDLKPQSSYNLDLMWQHGQRLTLSAFAMYMPDYFVQLAYQPSDRMAVIMKETNFNFANIHGLQATVRFNIGDWLNSTVAATATYHHDKSDHFFDLPFDRARLTGLFSSTTSIRLSKRQDLRLILNPFFQTRTLQGIYDIEPYFRLNSSLRWTSPNKKWSVVASGTNITNSHVSTRSSLGNQDYAMRMWLQYPNVSLTAVYRIGDFKEKKKKEVDTSRMGY